MNNSYKVTGIGDTNLLHQIYQETITQWPNSIYLPPDYGGPKEGHGLEFEYTTAEPVRLTEDEKKM